MKKWIRIASIVSSIVILSACSSAHKNHDAAVNDANAAYNGSDDSAQSSGLGAGSGLDEQGNGQVLSRRVYYFDYDQSNVHDADRPAINANADYLLAHPRAKILLEGHTDPRGSREYNIGLGERRAKAVAEILTSKGVGPQQVRVVSYGSEKLAAPGRSEADFRLDRRVVLVYLQK